MNKRLTAALIAAGLAITLGSPVVAKESIASLRGTHDLEAKSLKVKKKKLISQEGGFERSYKLQPPLIPHKIDRYHITIKNNGCLKCHSKKNHKREKAPMVSESHFITRDGKKLDHVAKRRWFCTQCHAPQLNARPLVKNVFEGWEPCQGDECYE